MGIHAVMIAALLGASNATASPSPSPWEVPAHPDPIPLGLSLFEVPRSLDLGYHFPTWEQAQDLHHGLIAAGHLGIHRAAHALLGNTPFWAYLTEMAATAALDAGTLVLPLGQAWSHEEGHASAMAILGMRTRQAFNPWGNCDPGSVCGLTDTEIAAAHDRRAADWIRVQEAGMETELEAATRMERDVFFHDRPAYQHAPYLAMQLSSVLLYRQLCATPDGFTQADVLAESQGIDRRDFTGPDCTGWVFDLFRPTTPYADRGPHPLGGIRRFRLYQDLAPEEQGYLRRMRNLTFLNFVDPFLFGVRGFRLPNPLGGEVLVNGAVRHHLTSFGDQLAVTVLARQEPWKVELTAHASSSQSQTLPGLTVQLHRYPLQLAGARLPTSAGASLWLQPKDQSFFATSAAPGAAAWASIALPLGSLVEAVLQVKAKTPGWMVADANLDSGLEAALGVNLLL